MGSVHVGRGAPPAFSPQVDGAFERADELVLEVDPKHSAHESERLMRRYALIPPPDSLRERLSSRALVALDAHLEARGQPLAPYLRFEPWALVELFSEEAKRRRGLDPAYGVDRTFAERARRTRKEVRELETTETQLRLLAELPASVHELRLLEAIADPEELGRRAEQLLRAWERGDDAALERILFDPLREEPGLAVFYQRVIFDRNERMARKLAHWARDGRLRFAVVGAGHVVGRRGIPALLHAQGFRIQKRKR